MGNVVRVISAKDNGVLELMVNLCIIDQVNGQNGRKLKEIHYGQSSSSYSNPLKTQVFIDTVFTVVLWFDDE